MSLAMPISAVHDCSPTLAECSLVAGGLCGRAYLWALFALPSSDRLSSSPSRWSLSPEIVSPLTEPRDEGREERRLLREADSRAPASMSALGPAALTLAAL